VLLKQHSDSIKRKLSSSPIHCVLTVLKLLNIQLSSAVFETHSAHTSLPATRQLSAGSCDVRSETVRGGGPQAIFLPQLCACPQARWANGKALPSDSSSITQMETARTLSRVQVLFYLTVSVLKTRYLV